MKRVSDGRVLELEFDADGGGLLVQQDDPALQSVYLTSREFKWLFRRAPLILLRSWWVRDGGGSDWLARLRRPEGDS